MNKCLSCGNDSQFNYCDWDCHVDAAKLSGGSVHVPNGLPVKSIKADGSMWEHEHGDHPDYKFPVDVEYVGRSSLHDPFDMVPSREVHALIYADSRIAVTLYEHCYSVFSLRSGLNEFGHYHIAGEWRLTDTSRAKIIERGITK